MFDSLGDSIDNVQDDIGAEYDEPEERQKMRFGKERNHFEESESMMQAENEPAPEWYVELPKKEKQYVDDIVLNHIESKAAEMISEAIGLELSDAILFVFWFQQNYKKPKRKKKKKVILFPDVYSEFTLDPVEVERFASEQEFEKGKNKNPKSNDDETENEEKEEEVRNTIKIVEENQNYQDENMDLNLKNMETKKLELNEMDLQYDDDFVPEAPEPFVPNKKKRKSKNGSSSSTVQPKEKFDKQPSEHLNMNDVQQSLDANVGI